MPPFVLGILLIIGSIVAIIAVRKSSLAAKKSGSALGLVALGAVIAFLGGIGLIAAGSHTTVPTRSVGVEVSYGKPLGVLSNGFHWIRPWASVETFDGTVQTVRLTGADALAVRLGNQTTAKVDASVQWQIDTTGDFLSLYRQYKTFDNIENNVIERQLANALNEVFESFNPLASLDANGNQTVHVTDLAAEVSAKLAAAMPAGLRIDNVTIPLITYDATVEAQINSIIAAASASRVAVQQEQTAAAIKKANDLLSAGNLTAGVLYQNCLTMTQSALKAGEQLPAGWSCGSPGAQVVIPTK